MKKSRIISLVAVAMLSLTVLAGCGGDKKDELKNGTYVVESAKADDKGNKSVLTMEVADGKISKVDYDELDKDGQGKETNEGYNKMMKDKVGTNPAEAFPKLEAAVVEKQSAEVDIVTGASSSSKSFISFVEKAIENAKAGKTEKDTL